MASAGVRVWRLLFYFEEVGWFSCASVPTIPSPYAKTIALTMVFTNGSEGIRTLDLLRDRETC